MSQLSFALFFFFRLSLRKPEVRSGLLIFKDLVVHAEIRTPHEIENEIGLTEGNIFQGELTIDQLLFNRPFPGYGQYRMPLKNMYMCGSSTHPGGGVSSACGANAAREILRDLKRPNTVPEDDFYDE